MAKIHPAYDVSLRQNKTATKPIDRIIYVAAIVEPLLLYPQALHIFRYENAQGISVLSWVGIDILTALWIWYAFVHKQKVVFIYQGLFFIANTFIIIGALLYGGKWF